MTLPARTPALLALLLILPGFNFAQQAPTSGPTPGCVLSDHVYHCSWASFRPTWDSARTVAVSSQRADLQAAGQLRRLLADFGKQPLPQDAPADLAVVIVQTAPNGVDYGPGDHDLATLSVYSAGDPGTRRVPLWVETLRGQGDRPWPAQVSALLAQFRDRFPRQR